ncbi:DUF2793 domain-containing protein [Rhizobium sp. TRM95796]|uniref:DUF2793 domain-containing protein n=1 Tax=Rhizobium sp. TRM95796 TaxID=2979862 RepID=UPI0021E99F83|nr:DUF2793 domain-containing protein [Rhizobium sp. TRM95796]MCV3765982.1 DUF2793 domain-containing protein [Rhizobium sp. TRM95796]
MTEKTTRLDLPYILSSQAQKHITHNEALQALDAIVHLAIRDTRGSPPPSPADGDCYWVSTPASGDWSGRGGSIAARESGAWIFHTPRPGWLAWFVETSALKVWTGGAWATLATA